MLLLLACTAKDVPVGDDTSSPTDDTGTTEASGWEEPEHPVFSLETLQTVRITMQSDWEDVLWTYAQEDDPCDGRRSIPGTVTFENAVTGVTEELGDANVRFRGHSALAAGPDSTTERPGFKLDFEPYGTDYQGREKLNLLGTEGDYTLIREALAFKLMRQLGLPAPDAGFALVYVNDEPMGVYPLSEEADGQDFLDAHFDDPDGHFYEVEGYCGGTGRLTWLGDAVDDYVDIYDPKAGTPDEAVLEDLEPLLDCVSNTGHDEFVACLPEHVELDAFLAHVAADMVMPDVDGLPSAAQNYLIYAEPGKGFVPVSYDKDQAFDLSNVTSESIYDLHPVWATDVDVELVDRMRELFADEYCAAVLDAAAWVEPTVLSSEVERLRAHLSDAIEADPFLELDLWNSVVNDILDVAEAHHPAVVAEAEACLPPTTEDPGTSNLELVPKRSTWRYHDDGAEPGATWTELGYSDDWFSVGQAPLGYEADDLNTTIAASGITSWFRHSFTVDEDQAGELLLLLRRDDGAVVYLDGEEILRDNMPEGRIAADTESAERVDGSDEETYWEHSVGTGLAAGEHVLAVELHQASSSSSDAVLDLSLEVTRD